MNTQNSGFLRKFIMSIAVVATVIVFAACQATPTPKPDSGGGTPTGESNSPPSISNAIFTLPLASTDIATLVASDPDANDSLDFAIGAAVDNANADVSSNFSISKIGTTRSASLTVAAGFLDAAKDPYMLTVSVSDGNNSAVSAVITIRVNSPPTIDTSTTLMPSSTSIVGGELGSVYASDPDGDRLRYTLVSSSPSSATDPTFAVNETTGVITLASGTVMATITYMVNVTVDDGINPPVSGTININPINTNAAPVIRDQDIDVAENVPASSTIGQVIATDGDPLTYSILSNAQTPSGEDIFAIESSGANAGMLSLSAGQSLNYSGAPAEHSITVSVDDGTNAAVSAVITIDVNRAPSIAAQMRTIAENMTGNIGDVLTASDPDADDTLSFEIVSVMPTMVMSSFTISSAGQLSLNSALDFETTATVRVTVRVSDNGAGTLNSIADVTVNVSNVFETIINISINHANNDTVTESFTLDASGTSPSTASFSWQEIDPPTTANTFVANLQTPNEASTDVVVYVEPGRTTTRNFRLTVTADDASSPVTEDIALTVSPGNIDLDGNGLIEIRGLTMLHNMRYNRFGTGYRTDNPGTELIGTNNNDPMLRGVNTGCPEIAGVSTCNGYELVGNLTFDLDNDGDTWTRDESTGTYSLDMDDNNDLYFPVASGGWNPIPRGASTKKFNAFFDGKGFTITGVAIQRSDTLIGFFAELGKDAVISNLGLVKNLTDYTGPGSADIGGLAGFAANSLVVSSYVTGGDVSSSQGQANTMGEILSQGTPTYPGAEDNIGGLIGKVDSTIIIATFSNSDVFAEGGSDENVGGLIGVLDGNSTLRSSYSTGTIDGGNGNVILAGGTIEPAVDTVSGLTNTAPGSISSVSNSYSTASISNAENSAGITWFTVGEVRASFANNESGNFAGMVTEESYTTVINKHGWTSANDATDLTLTIVNDPNDIITSSGVFNPNDDRWDSIEFLSKGAWDFGTTSEIPALNYADYDGPGTVDITNKSNYFYCEGEEKPALTNPASRTIQIHNCTTSAPRLIPNQR